MVYVSIIVPAFNCQETIKETLNSIRKQTFTDFEVWIINDGSDDSTKKLVDSYCGRDSRFKLYSQKNQGVSVARNMGVQLSQGEYVLFVDSDDIMFPNMLEQLYKEIKTNDYEMAICGYRMKAISKSGKVMFKDVTYKNAKYDSNKMIIEDFGQLLDSRLLNVVWNKLISRKFINNNKIEFDCFVSGEDTLYNVKLMKCINKMCIIQEPLYQYRRCNEGSLTTYFHINKFTALKQYNNALRELYIMWNRYNDQCIKQMDFYLIRSVISATSSLFDRSCRLNKDERKKFVREIVDDNSVQLAVRNVENDKLMIRIIAGIIKSKSIGINLAVGKSVYLVLKLGPLIVENMK